MIFQFVKLAKQIKPPTWNVNTFLDRNNSSLLVLPSRSLPSKYFKFNETIHIALLYNFYVVIVIFFSNSNNEKYFSCVYIYVYKIFQGNFSPLFLFSPLSVLITCFSFGQKWSLNSAWFTDSSTQSKSCK